MSLYVNVNIQDFYSQFPQFRENLIYQMICPICLSRATIYIPTKNKGVLCNEKRVLAIYLLTAHLSQLSYQATTGDSASSGKVAGATVDGVSISYAAVPNETQWDYWLNLTPYGAELLWLLDSLTATPKYYGGSFERVF